MAGAPFWGSLYMAGAHNKNNITDYMRTIHHRIIKERAQESLESQENVDAILMIVG